MPEFIDLNIDEHVAVITLNRTEAANALSETLLNELNKAIRDVNANRDVRCTIITGAGQKVFCAGADLKERRGMSDEQVIAAVRYIGETAIAIENMNMPVIAAINGAAFGGGMELALACDLRIAAGHVKMGLTETSLAIIPGAGGTQRLSRLVGSGQAKRLIYTAKPVNATEALHISLVEQTANYERLQETAMDLAKTIAGNGPVALAQAKTAINKGMQTGMHTALTIEHLCYRETIPTADRLEGLTAFKEKRKAEYHGK